VNPLTITTRATANGPVIALAGGLDCDSAPAVHRVLAALTLEPGQQLILDLGGVTFCDSTGISTFIAARNLTRAAHAALVLTAVPDRVQYIFSIVGLDQVLTVHPPSPPPTKQGPPQS
jgi:anti-anti-sigma factor